MVTQNILADKDLSLVEQILREAHSICRHWWFDKLDCSKSIYRESVDICFKDALEYLKIDHHIVPVCVYRTYPEDDHRYEFGFYTIGPQVDYFLWIITDVENGKRIIEQFDI